MNNENQKKRRQMSRSGDFPRILSLLCLFACLAACQKLPKAAIRSLSQLANPQSLCLLPIKPRLAAQLLGFGCRRLKVLLLSFAAWRIRLEAEDHRLSCVKRGHSVLFSHFSSFSPRLFTIIRLPSPSIIHRHVASSSSLHLITSPHHPPDISLGPARSIARSPLSSLALVYRHPL